MIMNRTIAKTGLKQSHEIAITVSDNMAEIRNTIPPVIAETRFANRGMKLNAIDNGFSIIFSPKNIIRKPINLNKFVVKALPCLYFSITSF